jgi:hypothetical protein
MFCGPLPLHFRFRLAASALVAKASRAMTARMRARITGLSGIFMARHDRPARRA